MFPTVHGVVSQGGSGTVTPPAGAADIPAATDYRLTAYETLGSTIADISELWLGSDGSTRFASGVTTEKSAGGTVAGIVDGSLTDTGNSQNLSGGCWWQLQYASPETLGHAKVARPNSTASRRLRTWAVRLLSGSQWLTALLRSSTDDMSSASTYYATDLPTDKVLVTPLFGTAIGGATAEAAVAASATLTVNRSGYVEANDAVLLAYGIVGSGPTEYDLTPPGSVETLYDGGGLFVGLRVTDAHGSEAASYAATNADASLRSMVGLSRILHNVDPASPLGSVVAAAGTKTAPTITVTPKQAILVVALYGTNETGALPPTGYTQVGAIGRAAAAGDLRIVAGLKAGQETGAVSPGDFDSTATPLRVVSIAINATTP